VTTILVSAGLAAVILVSALPIASWLSEIPVEAPLARPLAAEPLPVVRASQVVLARAGELYASGRPREALRLLETIDIADPLRPQADGLRANVQRALLAPVASSISSAETEP
jgi:hypothetical protein